MGGLLRLSVSIALTLALASPAPASWLDDARNAVGGAIDQGQQAANDLYQQGQQAANDLYQQGQQAYSQSQQATGNLYQRGQQAVGQIGQALQPLTQSDFRFDFLVDCTGVNAKAKPGESVTVTFNCRGGRSTVTVTVLGQTGTASFDTPLGSTSVPVTGIQNVGSLNVDLQGSLVGDVSSSGGASVSPSRLTWGNYGSQSVTVQVPSTATPGSRYTVTVTPRYTATVAGSVSALGTTLSIGSFTAPVADASPVQASVEVVKPGFLGMPGFEAPLAAIGLLAMALLWSRRRTG